MSKTASKNGSGVAKKAAKGVKGTTTRKIEISAVPKPESITVVLKGTTTFLSHKKNPEAAQQHEDKTTGKGKSKRLVNPEAEWEASLYRNAENKPCVLGRAIKSAIVEAAQKYWQKGTGPIINGTVFPTDQLFPLKFGKMEKRKDFLSIRGSGAHMSYRCEFFDWSVEVKFTYDAAHLDTEKLVNLLSRAGYSIGIGDDRPGKGKGGICGTFTVEATK